MRGACFGVPRVLDKSIIFTTMKTFKDVAVAGRTIWVSIGVPSGNHMKTRAMKKHVTREQVQKNNDRLAVRNLTLLLNRNFDTKSCHFTLTYKDAPDPEQAAKDRENFLRRMKRAVPGLRYVAVTEYKNVRVHHHIVMSTTDVTLVSEAWKKGFVMPTVLDKSGDYTDLAEYLIKETNKTFRDPDGIHKHRWSASRNLRKPVIKRTDVTVKDLEEDPQPIRGYYIPEDRIRRYEHPVTGLEYVEYLMVALDKPRSYDIWPRGKEVSGRERYGVDEENEQGELFAFFGI